VNSLYVVIALVLVAAIAAYWLFPRQVIDLMLAAGRRIARTRVKRIGVDGRQWYYLEGGRRDAPTVLLVHGFGADKDSWLIYAREFTRQYHVVAPDLPGFGEATRDPELGYTARAQAQHLRAFVDTLGLEQFHLAGISMGGYIAALYALDHPEQVLSLVLFDNAGVESDVTSPLRVSVDAGRNPLTVRTMEDVDEMIRLVTWKPPWIPGALKRYFLERARPDAELHDRIFWGLAEELENNPLNGQLRKIKMPTLIIWGRHDNLFPASIAEVMSKGIPDARAVILERTGHAPTIERPRLSAKHHLEFLGALAARLQPG
jgi:pimeloyl-ACP methyl ester carboxylesterase